MTQLRIVAEHAASDVVPTLEKLLFEHNLTSTGVADYHPVLFCVRDEANGFCGGITGYIWGGWLHITMLGLHESARGQGLGRALLEAAEHYARGLDCFDVYLNTFDFQAPGFYEKLGYRVFLSSIWAARGLPSWPHRVFSTQAFVATDRACEQRYSVRDY